jgi:hypothetical protein
MQRKMCIYICTFFVSFFSANIDGRNLIFGHKLHIGTPYRRNHFWAHQIPTSCLPILLIFIVYKNQQSRQTGNRNLTGPKTLPTIWYTYMMLVTKYQISAINSYWEKGSTVFLKNNCIVFEVFLTYIVRLLSQIEFTCRRVNIFATVKQMIYVGNTSNTIRLFPF